MNVSCLPCLLPPYPGFRRLCAKAEGLCTRPADPTIPLIVGRSRRIPAALLISKLLYAKHLTFQLLEAQRKKKTVDIIGMERF